MPEAFHVAVDLGGTNVRTALFSAESGRMEKRLRVPTTAARGLEPVLETILHAIEELLPPEKTAVKGIGIGAPGPSDPYKGVLVCPPNLPGWSNVPVQSWMEKRLGIPVKLGNDANLAAMGEWKFGAGRGVRDLVYLTISTGIGGGIICDGHLLLGRQGLAGELGHLVLDPNGPPCPCGGRGHLESLASGPSIARRTRELLQAGRKSRILELIDGRMESIDAAQVGLAAKDGDELAREVYREAGAWLGLAIANMVVTFNPSIVILGGGVINAGDLILDPAREAVERYAMDPAYVRDLQIVEAQLGDDCGLFGAFALSLEEHTPRT